MKYSWSLKDFEDLDLYPFDRCSENTVPPRKSVEELKQSVVKLDTAASKLAKKIEKEMKREQNVEANSLAKVKRIMKEMREVQQKPHPAFDVYPSEKDLSFWKVVVQGPVGTPYADGVFLFYIHFKREYPDIAPEIRFVTRIRHANINSYGRVCMSLLDRNWTPETTVSTLFLALYSLLLSPSREDPLDSTLALDFYHADGRYEADIMNAVKMHASKSRAAFCKELTKEELPAHDEKDEKGEKSHGGAKREQLTKPVSMSLDGSDDDDDDANSPPPPSMATPSASAAAAAASAPRSRSAVETSKKKRKSSSDEEDPPTKQKGASRKKRK